MDAGVIELNALANADGPRAQHHHGLLLPVLANEVQGLVLAAAFLGVVGGVKVGGVGGKLAGAGVHHFKGGLALPGNLLAGNPGNGRVRVAQPLALGVNFLRQGAGGQLVLIANEAQQLGEEPAVDHGERVELVYRAAPLQKLIDREQPLVRGMLRNVQQLLLRLLLELRQGQGVQPPAARARGDLRSPHSL